MSKDDFDGKLVLAALLVTIGILGGSYMLSQVDYATKVNVSDISTYPSVYVSSTPPDHAIAVTATASQKVSPDLLVIQLRIQTEDGNAKRSQTDNANVTAQVKSELNKLGLEDKDIQTTSYRLDPVRRSLQRCDVKGSCYWETVTTGYRTTHVLTISLSDLTKGGDVIDSATAVGTNETFVDYVTFTLKDETRRKLEKDLLTLAAQNATAKAQNIASGLGESLGKPLSASESFSYPYYYSDMYYKSAVAYEAGAPSTELSAGEVEASATVSVSYEIS